MPWFKVDDNLGFHHKVIAAGNPAMGLWVRAGSVCAQQLTDGFVPHHLAVALGTPAQAARLVKVGLWDTAEGGFRFHEWGERQPSKVDVEAERAAAKERMRAARERKRKRSPETSAQVSGSRSPEQTPKFGRSSAEVRDVFGDPDPTRPDPTILEEPTVLPAAAAAAPKGKRATQRPAEFRPTQAHVDLAAELGVDIAAEWQQFCDHHDAKGSTYKDWSAALRTWIRNAKKFGRSSTQQTRVQQHVALAQQLAQEQLEVGEAR